MIRATTVWKAPASLVRKARARAEALGLPFEERTKPLDQMGSGDGSFLIYGKKEPLLWHGGDIHTFHTGTAKLRLLAMKRGGEDRLCRLLPEGTASVLDCTFGEGKDSMVLSWYLGKEGQVTALEKSGALWEIGFYGLGHFEDPDPEMTEALRRIRLVHADFRTFLEEALPCSYDVIYFDTMFKRPVKREENKRDAFRSGACYDGLDEETLRLAMRAARRRVIVKERPFSPLFRLGLFQDVQYRRGQTTAYGVIDIPTALSPAAETAGKES